MATHSSKFPTNSTYSRVSYNRHQLNYRNYHDHAQKALPWLLLLDSQSTTTQSTRVQSLKIDKAVKVEEHIQTTNEQ